MAPPGVQPTANSGLATGPEVANAAAATSPAATPPLRDPALRTTTPSMP